MKLTRLCDSEKKIKIITRSPKQYEQIEVEDVSVEQITDFQGYQNCCRAFDDMLDSNQKLTDPFFTRGRHNDLDIIYYLSQSYFDLPLRTIRNNSNIYNFISTNFKRCYAYL